MRRRSHRRRRTARNRRKKRFVIDAYIYCIMNLVLVHFFFNIFIHSVLDGKEKVGNLQVLYDILKYIILFACVKLIAITSRYSYKLVPEEASEKLKYKYLNLSFM